ncbi:thioesterase family protein, partial [Prosthecodimorpha hirschii]
VENSLGAGPPAVLDANPLLRRPAGPFVRLDRSGPGIEDRRFDADPSPIRTLPRRERPKTMTEPHAAIPLVTGVMAIEPAWIDYNGHLNMAYYNVLFDRAADEILGHAGLGPDYIATRNLSFMTAEIHVCYVREVFLADPVTVTMRFLDLDAKRLHVFAELRHATEGWLSATSEQMYLHVDMAARRTAPFPEDVMATLTAMKAQDDGKPWPERAGRKIGIVRKG